MKRCVVAMLAITLLTWTACVMADDGADPTGTWKWKFPNQSAEQTLKLKWEGGVLTGAILRRAKEVPIEEATFKDGMVNFKVVFTSEQGDGMKIPAKFSGTFRGAAITGTIEYKHPSQTVSRDWRARRAEERP